MPVWNIPYDITDQEYLDFNEHFLRRTPQGKKSLLVYRVLMPALTVLLMPFIVNWQDTITAVIQIIVLAVFFVIWWFLCVRILLHSTKRRLRKANSMEKSLYSESGQLVFDFENRLIIDTGDRAEVRVLFDNVTVCYETDRAFYFYFAQSRAIMLPYRLFRTPEDFYEFQNLIHYNFPCEM